MDCQTPPLASKGGCRLRHELSGAQRTPHSKAYCSWFIPGDGGGIPNPAGMRLGGMRCKRECNLPDGSNAEPWGADTSIYPLQSGSQPFRGLLSRNSPPYCSPYPKPSKSRGSGGTDDTRMQGSCRSSVAGGGRRGGTLAATGRRQIAQCRCTNPSRSPLPLPAFFFFLNE